MRITLSELPLHDRFLENSSCQFSHQVLLAVRVPYCESVPVYANWTSFPRLLSRHTLNAIFYTRQSLSAVLHSVLGITFVPLLFFMLP